jgi:hypothetical protein
MLSAFIFGLVASSALVTGAVAGAYWTPPRPLLAAALAFASGVLMPEPTERAVNGSPSPRPQASCCRS